MIGKSQVIKSLRGFIIISNFNSKQKTPSQLMIFGRTLAKGIKIWIGEFQNKKPLSNNNDLGDAVIINSTGVERNYPTQLFK
jgi:hypothetical protein